MNTAGTAFRSELERRGFLAQAGAESWLPGPARAPGAGTPPFRAVTPGDGALREAIAAAGGDELQVVVADCPLLAWGDAALGTCFGALVDLKQQGFAARYDRPVLPVDTSDFVATHVLSCLPFGGALYPLAAYRLIDTGRCTDFNLGFPARSLVAAANAALHARGIEQFLRRHPRTSYIGSWTIHPLVQHNPGLRRALREHFVVGAPLVHADRSSALLVGATLRFGVDRLLRGAGFDLLGVEGETLPSLGAGHLHGERVQLMCLAGDPRLAPARRAPVVSCFARALRLPTTATAQ